MECLQTATLQLNVFAEKRKLQNKPLIYIYIKKHGSSTWSATVTMAMIKGSNRVHQEHSCLSGLLPDALRPVAAEGHESNIEFAARFVRFPTHR